MTRQVTHSYHQKDFDAGYYSAKDEIKKIGWRAVAEKWRAENKENPISLSDYYYSDGAMTAITESM